MIKYRLICRCDHEFEGWFRSSADFDEQSDARLLECPACGSDAVRKAIMAPAIGRKQNATPSMREQRLREISETIAQAAERARDYVERNFDYVGDRFPEEARKIHYGEVKPRGVYGEATPKETSELIDEGVAIAPLPKARKNTDKAGAPVLPASGAEKPKLN